MKKVPVSERALAARIERALTKSDRTLKRSREDSRWFHDLGRYYCVDLSRNMIVEKHVDLEDLGRKLGVLSAFESLAEGQ